MPELPLDSPEPVLRGETVVFAGKLWSLGRKDRRALVERLGGRADDDVTRATTILVVGAATYPNGIPDERDLRASASTHDQKLRRAWARLRDAPAGQARERDAPAGQARERDASADHGLEHDTSAEQALGDTSSVSLRILSEDEFCRLVGLPPIDDLRRQHYGQRDILAMYPALREDHLRYLRKWGLLEPAFRNAADTWFTFADLTLLRHVQAELQQGVAFRSILRDLQASRSGQLAFDFRIEAEPARILALTPRTTSAGHATSLGTAPGASKGEHGGRTASSASTLGPGAGPMSGVERPLTEAEMFFLQGSILDDGSPERAEEAAQAYREALDRDPELVAAIINLANIRYARDELAEAQALYERAIGLDQGFFEAYFNLGNIHHDHSAYQDAELCYRHAVALNPSYADGHFYLAVTLEKMGRSSDAQPHWRAYQALAPEGEWVELAKEFSDM